MCGSGRLSSDHTYTPHHETYTHQRSRWKKKEGVQTEKRPIKGVRRQTEDNREGEESIKINGGVQVRQVAVSTQVLLIN